MTVLYRLLVSGWLIWALGGCATQATMQGAMGGQAKLTFRQHSPSSLWWRESPVYAEAMMPIPPLSGCGHPTLYINPQSGNRNRLDHHPLSVRPLSLANAGDLSDLWRHVDGDRCAIVVFAGQLRYTTFQGVILMTREKTISQMYAQLAEDVEADTGRLVLWPLRVLIYDVPYTLFGAGLATGAAIREMDPVTAAVTVSFILPDGARYSTSITIDEARRVLKATDYRSRKPVSYADWEVARFWARAALVKLELAFREQLEPENYGTYRFPQLMHVAGLGGLWVYQVTGDPSLNANLSEHLGEHFTTSRELTFSLRYRFSN